MPRILVFWLRSRPRFECQTPSAMAYAQKLALATAVFVCGGMWIYVDRVLIAHQEAEARLRGTPRGNLSDLYPSWLASRELLLNHRDPYTPEITREIQTGYYGRPIEPARPNDPTNQQAFAYPVYVAFLLAPSVKLPFSEVQVLFRWLLAGLTALSVILWLGVIGLRLSWVLPTVVVLLVFGTFPVVQGIKLQQLSLLRSRGNSVGVGHDQASTHSLAGRLADIVGALPAVLALQVCGGVCPDASCAGGCGRSPASRVDPRILCCGPQLPKIRGESIVAW